VAALAAPAVAQFARGAVKMPDHARLIRELRLLERRVSRSGQDSVDHPKHGSDDYSNSLVGALWRARSIPKVTFPPGVEVFTQPRATQFDNNIIGRLPLPYGF
jgi:hypothetical protein